MDINDNVTQLIKDKQWHQDQQKAHEQIEEQVWQAASSRWEILPCAHKIRLQAIYPKQQKQKQSTQITPLFSPFFVGSKRSTP